MSKKFLLAVMLSFVFAPSFVLADYVTPEDLIEISPGVKARSRSAKLIKQYNIADAVSDLYKNDIPNMQNGITLVQSADGCLSLFINTRNGQKNFINQADVNDEKKCTQYFGKS
ncbi:MAG: hypothetical protein J0G29_01770 [Alphaproteobacteria bacterium]|nr:hypothetical protein [Alphaproteobacteria bacterium]OJV46993.1 MAG: hypothetical protein BGO28_06615 [Alphaproteobacteria bacterium 43-37]